MNSRKLILIVLLTSGIFNSLSAQKNTLDSLTPISDSIESVLNDTSLDLFDTTYLNSAISKLTTVKIELEKIKLNSGCGKRKKMATANFKNQVSRLYSYYNQIKNALDAQKNNGHSTDIRFILYKHYDEILKDYYNAKFELVRRNLIYKK